MMVELEGSHGTSVTRAHSICKLGFIEGNRNFWGNGVYFFHRKPNGTKNARYWHKESFRHYADDANPSCAVVHADLATPRNTFFDLSHPKFLKHIQTLIKKTEEESKRPLSNDDKNGIRDVFVKNMEKKRSCACQILDTTIPIPGSFYDTRPPLRCIVVKDVNCIMQPYEIEVSHGR